MADETKSKMRRGLQVIKAVLQILLVLLLVQGLRAALHWAGWRILNPGMDSVWPDVIAISSLLLTGALFWLLLRPSKAALGLKWAATRPGERIGLFMGAGLLLGLLLSSALLDPSLIAADLHAALVVPVFEELLFRGWCWARLERMLPGRWGAFFCFILITGLFAVWHLGYADVVYLRGLQAPAGSPPLRVNLVLKVLVGGAVGLMTGFARWRTGKVYWPVVLHGLWNIFGR